MVTSSSAAARLFILAAAALAAAAPAGAQIQPDSNTRPMAIPLPRAVPDPQDIPYPGTITLDIDATDVTTGAFRVTQTIPVPQGATRLTLLYPDWLPGKHGARGRPAFLGDLAFLAGNAALTWTRDPVDVMAYHVDVPRGTAAITARFVFTSLLRDNEDDDRVVMTREMLNLQWEKMSLYPAGHYVRQIKVKPTVTFPQGWTVFTALDGKVVAGNRFTWDLTDYETLVDSPIFAGLHAKRFDLGQSVFLDAVADKPEQLAIAPENLRTYRSLVLEAQATFGSKPFDHYDFLLALTERMTTIGLEHHRSSENQYEPASWTDWTAGDWDRGVIPHEYVHAWNGKFRRPAKLWTPDYRTPMQDNLLWVYEGQTQFWGSVLAARSGVQSKEMILANLANWAGSFTQYPGRAWRSVEDTTHDPIFAARKPKPFTSLSRSEEYYTEGALVWLEADQIIRDGTGGKRGLDDFARTFFGIRDGDWGTVPYEFEDVVAALNTVYPHDWAGFLKTRMQTPGQPAPLGGIERGGYKLVWKDEPNALDKVRMTAGKFLTLNHSLGLAITNDGKVTGTRWDSPAFRAGIVPGAQIVAVDGKAYDQDTIKAAVTAAKGTTKPIDLLIKRDDLYRTVQIPYYDGLRWPWLERAVPGNVPVGLDRLLAPRASAKPAVRTDEKPAPAK